MTAADGPDVGQVDDRAVRASQQVLDKHLAAARAQPAAPEGARVHARAAEVASEEVAAVAVGPPVADQVVAGEPRQIVGDKDEEKDEKDAANDQADDHADGVACGALVGVVAEL